jgi:hypothetical protein
MMNVSTLNREADIHFYCPVALPVEKIVVTLPRFFEVSSVMGN